MSMATAETKTIDQKWSNPYGLNATIFEAVNRLIVLKTFFEKAWTDWQSHGH